MTEQPQLRVLHAAVSMSPSLGVVKQMEWEQQAANKLRLPWKVVLHTAEKIDSSIVHICKKLPKFSLLQYFFLRKYFYRWLLSVEKEYDLIILRHSVHDIFENRLASRLGHKLITMHHTLEGYELNAHGLFGPLRAFAEESLGRATLKRSLGIVAVTREILEYERLRELSTVIKPYFIYPNGVWINSKDVSDLRTETPELIFVANYFSEWHGLDLLIDEVQKSRRKFRVHVVGKVSKENAVRCAKDERFVMHGTLGKVALGNIMALSWCGLSSFSLDRKGMKEACSLKVREYLVAGVPVYAGHKDAGLPDNFKFYKHGAVNIDKLLMFAERMRFISRAEVIKESTPYISKLALLDSFYNEINRQLKLPILGVSKDLMDYRNPANSLKRKGIIAITGASGFIGKQLVPSLLADGWRVRVLTRYPKKWITDESIEVFEGDLLTTNNWNSFVADAVVLLNAAAEINTASLMMAVNLDAPSKLLEAAISAGVKRWVQLSSVGAYGNKLKGWIDEQTLENPSGPYEESKTFFDQHLRTISKTTGLEICIVRPSNVYGPQMTNQSLLQMLRMVRRGLFAYMGPTGASANYVHVDDVVSALVLCSSSPAAAGQTYNVSDWTTIENMVRSISASLNVQPPSIRLPLTLARVLASLLQGVPRWPLTLGRVDALSKRVRYDISKIEKELGWAVSKPLVKGVIELCLLEQKHKDQPLQGNMTGEVSRLLIVTYDWPPRNSIATHRPYSWARYWAAQGIDVTVLTAKKKFFDQPLDLALPVLDGVTVVEAPYNTWIPKSETADKGMPSLFVKFLKKAKFFFSYMINWDFDVRAGWAGAADRIIEDLGTNFDVVVSTYGPDSSHRIASKFKRANPSLFWVADYRDLWSLNARKGRSKLIKAIVKRQEINIINSANLFTTVSNELARNLQGLVKKQPLVIYNGFDIDFDPLCYSKPNRLNNGRLQVLYTGRIYPGKRNPAVLVRAVELLIDSGLVTTDQISIEFYGVNTSLVAAEIGTMKYPRLVKLNGYVTRDQALNLQQSADLLLLLESGEEDSKGFLTGKIFEYIATGRPIISLGSSADSAIARVLNETRCGRCYVDDVISLAEDLQRVLSGHPLEWFNPDLFAINKYSRKYQAELLIDEIKNKRNKNI